MNTTKLSIMSPVIPVDDIDKITSFYIDKLGFTKTYDSGEYEEGPINYVILCRNHICFHFQLFDSIKGFTSPQIRIGVENIDALYSELKERGAHIKNTLQKTPWNTVEFGLFDPNMVGLIFYEGISKEK